MKFTRKLFSIVSAMSMAACVFASPVFADESTESSSDISTTEDDIDRELGDVPVPTNEPEANGAQVQPETGNKKENTSSTSSFIRIDDKDRPFDYNKNNLSRTMTVDARFSIVHPDNEQGEGTEIIPSNLTYTVTWKGDGAKVDLSNVKIRINGGVPSPDIPVTVVQGNSNAFMLTFKKEDIEEIKAKDNNLNIHVSIPLQCSKDCEKITLEETFQLAKTSSAEYTPESFEETIKFESDDADSSEDDSSATIIKGLKFTDDVDYSSKDNTLTLNLKVPTSVVAAKEDLTAEIMGIASSGLSNVKLDELDGLSSAEIQEALLKQITSNTKLLESLESIRIGKGTSYKEYKGSEISGWVTKETGINSYSIEIPGANLNSDISFIFKTNADQSVVENASVLAWAHSKSAVSQIYAGKIVADKDPDSPYLITAGYTANDSSDTAKRNTYGLQISDKATDALNPFADTNATTVLTITSDPNVLTGITDFSIGKVNYSVIEDATNGITITKKNGTETAPVDSQTPAGDDASDTENEASENALSAKKTNNGYEIVIPNSDLAGLGKDEYIDFLFSTKPDLTTATINVNVASSNGQYTGSFSQQIKGGSGNTSNPGTNGGTSSETGNPISQNAAFKASHNYDSATQTWTVTLNMTGRPPKLDLTFNQKEGTALLKPNSFTINNAAVSPTVNATMSGSKMSVCTVSFSQDDLAKVGSGSVVKLVFPVDGSKEQTEKITMTVATGNASKDLNATFTVKKTTNGGVPTATETGAQPMIIVLVIALIALAVFGFLAFRKKKK